MHQKDFFCLKNNVEIIFKILPKICTRLWRNEKTKWLLSLKFAYQLIKREYLLI